MTLVAQEITEFLSTNLKNPYPEWTKSTMYKALNKVRYHNYVYMSVTNDNRGVAPDLNSGKWLLMEVDNAYASIDLHSHTGTIGNKDTITNPASKEITYEFSGSGVTTLVLGGVKADEVIVEQYRGANLLHTKNYPVAGVRKVNSWYKYYFDPLPTSGTGNIFVDTRDIVIRNILPNTDTIKVVVKFTSDGEAVVNAMVAGKGQYLGDTQYGVNVNVVDYSEKIIDPKTGITELVEHDSVELMSIPLKINAIDTMPSKREIKKALGKVNMFIVDDAEKSYYESLIIMAYPEKFSIMITNQVIADAQLKLREVI